jgi:hypothetical protein
MTIPVAPNASPTHQPALTMFGPDFPFPYDAYVSHREGLGSIPQQHHGREVAIIGGGLAGTVAARELLSMGLKPILYEAGDIGGRMRSHEFDAFGMAQSFRHRRLSSHRVRPIAASFCVDRPMASPDDPTAEGIAEDCASSVGRGRAGAVRRVDHAQAQREPCDLGLAPGCTVIALLLASCNTSAVKDPRLASFRSSAVDD